MTELLGNDNGEDMAMKQKTANLTLFILITLSCLVVAHGVGWWVSAAIPLYGTLEVSGLLHLTHVRNFGGVFGVWQGAGWVFGLVSGLLLAGITAYLVLSRRARLYEYVCFGFVVGGGGANVVDRLVYGSVVDYIDIQHIPYWDYVFNAADVMIHLGVWPLLVFGFLYDRRGDER